MRIFNSLYKRIVLAILIFLVLLAFFFRFSITFEDYYADLKQVFFNKVNVALSTCSPNVPKWMPDVVALVANEGYAGMQFAHMDASGNLFTCEFGRSDGSKWGEKITSDTRFKYASVTKLFTAEMIFHLIRDGKLTLNDKLTDILPLKNPVDNRVNDITIGHLLDHRAGFDRDKRFDQMFALKKQDIWCPKDYPHLGEIQLDFDPGSRMVYSNVGYCLLGLVIEQKTGLPFRDAVENYFNFDALGFKFADNPDYFPDEVVYFFDPDNTLSRYMNYFDFYSLSSSAGLTGNAKSLVKRVFDMARQPEPNILSYELSRDCDRAQWRGCYGYAMFEILTKNGNKGYVREGNLPGLVSTVVVGEDREVSAVLINQRQPAKDQGILRAVESLISDSIRLEQ